MWADRAQQRNSRRPGAKPSEGPAGPARCAPTPQELHVCAAWAVAHGRQPTARCSSSLFPEPQDHRDAPERHIYYRKLGIRSRTDLAVRFAGRRQCRIRSSPPRPGTLPRFVTKEDEHHERRKSEPMSRWARLEVAGGADNCSCGSRSGSANCPSHSHLTGAS